MSLIDLSAPAPPVGLTVSVMTDDGSGAVYRIEGSAKWAGERLAYLGGHILVTIPLIAPGTVKLFEYIQARQG